MKCPKCDHENPEYAVYCGMCNEELRSGTESSGGSSMPQTMHMADPALEQIVSIAVNMRRIFIVLALGVLVTISVHLYSAVVFGYDDPEDLILMTRIWYLATAIAVALGLYYAVKMKGITRL
jgi:hypothetical protein